MTSVGVLDREAELPTHVSVVFEDGLTCKTATCVIVGSRLYLVPPSQTPPLEDRVPRQANGAPLLTDSCPVSSKIFCDDYAARTGCNCDSGAPSGPDECQDVSEFACEGAFTQSGDEWKLDEVAQAGCSCTAVDPNEPATFGS